MGSKGVLSLSETGRRPITARVERNCATSAKARCLRCQLLTYRSRQARVNRSAMNALLESIRYTEVHMLDRRRSHRTREQYFATGNRCVHTDHRQLTASWTAHRCEHVDQRHSPQQRIYTSPLQASDRHTEDVFDDQDIGNVRSGLVRVSTADDHERPI